MRNYIELGSVPYEEKCAQVGSPGYQNQGLAECKAFSNQLHRTFPNHICRLCVKRLTHDFGSYYEVCAVFDSDDEAQINEAYDIEASIPAHWDSEARKELTMCSNT